MMTEEEFAKLSPVDKLKHVTAGMRRLVADLVDLAESVKRPG